MSRDPSPSHQHSLQISSARPVPPDASVRGQNTSQRAAWKQLYDAQDLERTELRVLREEGEQLSKLLKKIAPNDTRDTWTYTDLEVAVNDARQKWTSKTRIGGGKAQRFFHNLMGKFDSHSGLFAIIPTEDRYLSLLTGGITILVKASTSHSKTIEELNDALEQISELVALCDAESRLIRSEMMQNAVAKLYIAIFLFLGDAIRWYNSSSTSKVLNSLHNDYSEGFRSAVERVRKMAHQVQHIASLGSAAETRVIRLDLEELREELHDNRVGLSGQLRFIAEMVRDSLEQHRSTQQLIRESEAARVLSASPPAAIEGNLDRQLLLTDTDTSYARDKVPSPINIGRQPTSISDNSILQDEDTLSLRALVKRLHAERQLDHTSSSLTPEVSTANLYPINIASPINSWLASTNKPLLYLEFPANTAQSSPYYMAAHILRTCQSAGVKCISHYPTKARHLPTADEDATAANSSSASPLTDMALSLAQQILSLTPPSSSSANEIPAPAALATQTQSTTTDAAISLLQAALQSTPPSTQIYAIIDAVGTFSRESNDNDNSAEAATTQFLTLIRGDDQKIGPSATARQHGILKVLLLSHRRAHSLLSQLDASEVSIVSAPPPAARRARPVMVPIALRR